MLPRLLACFIFISSALLSAVEASRAEERKPTEYDVKAAYIYNFAKFVEWPPGKSSDAGATIAVCVLGKDPFGPALATIEGKSVGERKIRVKRNPPLQEAKNCDIVFIAASEKEQLSRILEALGNSGVLTVGDTEGFARQGVMINFYMENKNVRFAINPKAAGRAGLKISSGLLRIARIVGE